MPPDAPSERWSRRVRPLRVSLLHVRFDDRAEPFSGPYEPDALAFGLELARLSPLHLTVELTVSTEETAPVAFTVTYAAEYEMSGDVPEEARDEAWRHVAYHVAPALLYPYVRELFANLTGRWRGGAVTLPFAPIPLRLPADEQVIPPPPLPE